MRKMMIKYGGKSTDIVKQKGTTITVTTVNAKGSWTRKLATDKVVHQVCRGIYLNRARTIHCAQARYSCRQKLF
jgi:predicted secreted protein